MISLQGENTETKDHQYAPESEDFDAEVYEVGGVAVVCRSTPPAIRMLMPGRKE